MQFTATQTATFPTASNESKSLIHVSEIILVGCLKEIFFLKLNCFRFLPIALLYNQKKKKKRKREKEKGI